MARYKKISIVLALSTLLCACSNKPTGIMALTDAQMDAQAAIELLNIDHVAAARNKANQAIDMDPKAPSSWYVLGYLNEATGNMAEAEKDYKKAISVKPDSGTAHNNYGTFLCHQDRVNEAVAQFSIAAQAPRYYDADTAYENAGLCLQRIGKITEARDYFAKAVGLNPYLAHSLFELAVIDYQLHDYYQSKFYLDQYRSAVDTPGPLSKKLQAYLKMKNHPPLVDNLPAPMHG